MYEKAFKWSCSDECKYHCMWITVEAFQKDGLDVPQFYGKVNLIFIPLTYCQGSMSGGI